MDPDYNGPLKHVSKFEIDHLQYSYSRQALSELFNVILTAQPEERVAMIADATVALESLSSPEVIRQYEQATNGIDPTLLNSITTTLINEIPSLQDAATAPMVEDNTNTDDFSTRDDSVEVLSTDEEGPSTSAAGKRKATEAGDQVTKRKRKRRGAPKLEKPLKNTRKIKTIGDLTELSIAMNDKFSTPVIKDIQTQYFNKLLEIPRPAGNRHNTRVDQEDDKLFDVTTAAQLTEFFFSNTMGESGMTQISKFVHEYSPEPGENRHDAGTANRLRGIALDPHCPIVLKNFCAALSAETTREQEETSVIGHIIGLHRTWQAYDTYAQLCDKIDNDSGAMWAFIQSKVTAEKVKEIKDTTRVQTASGISHASVAIDLLVSLGGLNRDTFVARNDKARPLALLLSKLGKGFILLLPVSSVTFLKTVGPGKVGPACDVLLELCPYLPDFVKLLDKFIWRPYQQGASVLPLDVDCLAPHPGESRFLQQLHEAVNTYQVKQQAHAAAVEDGASHSQVPLPRGSQGRITGELEDV